MAKQIRAIVERPEMLAWVTEVLQQQHSQRAPAIEQELTPMTSTLLRTRHFAASCPVFVGFLASL